MEKEKYTQKDFDLSLNTDAVTRANGFQMLMDELDHYGHKIYWNESVNGIGTHMKLVQNGVQQKGHMTSFVSNDYLGMSKHPETIQAGIDALVKYGTGACAAPIIGGYLDIHKQLEKEIAAFTGQEEAIIFSSGYGANVGALGALLGKNDIALIDSFIHASVLEGLRSTNVKNIGHNDIDYLDKTLANVTDKYVTKMVIIDGVYSQNGDISTLPQIKEVCDRHGALLMLDDAHGIGVFGETGRGVAEHYNMLSQVDIVTGTFSKAFGCVGGFVAASPKLIQYLRYYAGSSVFSAAPTPQVTSSTLKALELTKAKPEIRQKLWSNVNYLRTTLLNKGFDIGTSVSPIFPVMVRDDFKVKRASSLLKEEGVYAIGICYPAVSKKESRIRTTVIASHEIEDLDNYVKALCKVDEKIGIRKAK